MNGKGNMTNPDNTSYEGDWSNNLMHGEGIYIDKNGSRWEGIFINGSYESKIQKKLRAEKEIKDALTSYKTSAKTFFTQFEQAATKLDKKSLKA